MCDVWFRCVQCCAAESGGTSLFRALRCLGFRGEREREIGSRDGCTRCVTQGLLHTNLPRVTNKIERGLVWFGNARVVDPKDGNP